MNDMAAFAGVTLGQTSPRNHAARRPDAHIYCEAGGALAEAAGALCRNRLGVGEIRIVEGGLAAARAAYERASSPALIVVETHLERGALLGALDDLATVCEPHTKLIIVGRINDVHLYRELIRRGVSDYLVAPAGTEQLAAACLSALRPEAGPETARCIAVTGAKGGCGASTICHNLGWALAEMACTDTVIADFDDAFGTLGLNFNQDAGHGLTGALAAGAKLDSAMMGKLLARCSDHLSLLTASCSLARDPEIETATALRIAALLRQHGQAVFLDIPCGWRDWSRALLETADDCVIVAEPDLANLRNARSLIEAARAARRDRRPPFLVLNKAGTPRRPEVSIGDFADAAGLTPALVIGFDARAFGMAANNGLMIGEMLPKSTLPARFLGLAAELGGVTPPKPHLRRAGGLLRLLSRLAGRTTER